MDTLRDLYERLVGGKDKHEIPHNPYPRQNVPRDIGKDPAPNHVQDQRGRHPLDILFGQSVGGIEREFAEMERDMMQLFGGAIPGMGRDFPSFPEMSGIQGSMTSQSVRTQIRTMEDGSVEERRTIVTHGPDGPREETSVTIHPAGENVSAFPGPSGIPDNDIGQLFGALFGGHPAIGHSDNRPSEHSERPAIVPGHNSVRSQFLSGSVSPPQPKNRNLQTEKFEPPFETPDFSKKFSEDLSKFIRP